MLRALTIQNVVLVEKLDIVFDKGLCVLTGETGAGKSILLDALALATGERATSRLVRQGQKQASVTACFTPAKNHPCFATLDEHGIESEDEILLRRILTSEGRSRAFINDQAVSIGLLKLIGEQLIEIHGQFDRLLQPKNHRQFLDSYAEAKLGAVRDAYSEWKTAQEELETARKTAEEKLINEAFLREALEELKVIEPKDGEESELVEKRSRIANAAKLAELSQEILSSLESHEGVKPMLNKTLRLVEKSSHIEGTAFEPVTQAINSAFIEIEEASEQLHDILADCANGPAELDAIEKRIIQIRTLAKKHRCLPEELCQIYQQFENDLRLIDNSDDILVDLENVEKEKKASYVAAADKIHEIRVKAAQKLDDTLVAELKPLKLENAQFKTQVSALPESLWGPEGTDEVKFTVATNKGTNLGDLKTIASGGERSRFMLALKVILSRTSTIPTLIFDEIDTGIGGATARAVGERLSTLSQDLQVISITHSPQVASLADQHLKVKKESSKDTTVSSVENLSPELRREEVARMLSGEDITTEARAAADKLMQAS